MSFSRSLKQFRESANLSQREVARRIGVNESTYRQWEYGTTISGEPYPKIAEAFGITLDELFGLTKNPGKHPMWVCPEGGSGTYVGVIHFGLKPRYLSCPRRELAITQEIKRFA